jgi:glutamate dehydrogenase
MDYNGETSNLKERLELWGTTQATLIARWRYILNDLRSTSVLSYTMYFVAIRQLLDLMQTTLERSVEVEIV